MTTELPCALAGCPANKKVILGLIIYFVFLFLVLGTVFIMAWTILQEAMYTAINSPEGLKLTGGQLTAMSNIVETVGTKSSFAVTPMAIGNKIVFVIPDSLAVLTVMASGAFGGLIHAIRSLYFHVREGDFGQDDAIKLFLRPFSGAILALIFYLVLRAGLGDGTQKADGGASIMLYTAIGAIVGMFTDQTVSKLKKIAEAILTKPDEKQDVEEEQK